MCRWRRCEEQGRGDHDYARLELGGRGSLKGTTGLLVGAVWRRGERGSRLSWTGVGGLWCRGL